MAEPMREKILSQIERITESGCWIWMGSVNKAGYGLMSRPPGGKPGTIGAHRAAYEALVGPIPAGLELDHLCRVRPCVNPDHLEPVTKRVNVLRSNAWSGKNSRKTACPKCGSEYRLNRRGGRVCPQRNRKFHQPPFSKVKKTHCSHGHEMSPGNVVVRRNYLACLTCERESNRRASRKRPKGPAYREYMREAQRRYVQRKRERLAQAQGDTETH